MTNSRGQPYALPEPPNLTAEEIDRELWSMLGRRRSRKAIRYWYARLLRIKHAQP